MIPTTRQDFLSEAAECERLAGEIQTPRYRETILYVASRWRAMAEAYEMHKPRETERKVG
jgi:hypothetical protein